MRVFGNKRVLLALAVTALAAASTAQAAHAPLRGAVRGLQEAPAAVEVAAAGGGAPVENVAPDAAVAPAPVDAAAPVADVPAPVEVAAPAPPTPDATEKAPEVRCLVVVVYSASRRCQTIGRG